MDGYISRAETTSFDLGRKPSFLSWDNGHDDDWLVVINFNNRVVFIVDFYPLPGRERFPPGRINCVYEPGESIGQHLLVGLRVLSTPDGIVELAMSGSLLLGFILYKICY